MPVSPHGINSEEPLDDVLAMAVSRNTLYAAGYNTGSSDREAELWSAAVGDERWRLVRHITGMRRPEAMAVHGGNDEGGIVYVGGTGIENNAMLVRFHKVRGTEAIALPVTGGRVLTSLLSKGPYLFATIDRVEGAADATIWRTSRPSDAGAWIRIGPEISTGRPHIHSMILGMGRGDEILVGTGRESPGGRGATGTGAEVWRGTEYGLRWEQIAVDGFGDPDTGAISALQSLHDVWGSDHIYAGALNHTAGSTIYKSYPGARWSALPYGSGLTAPIRSMATFAGRLFIAEGNNPEGARLFYTMSGDGWLPDGPFAYPYAFGGSGGELPLALHALTPSHVGAPTSRFLYVAVQYRGVGVKIWRRTLDLWDSAIRSIFRVGRLALPLPWRWGIEI